MKIALMFVTDGRTDVALRTLGSLFEQLPFEKFAYSVLVDDSTNPDHGLAIEESFVFTQSTPVLSAKRGFDGAIRAGWSMIPDYVDYVFHVEDDFMFVRYPALQSMAHVLERREHVVQVALKRQACNEEEEAAGGLIQRDWDSYEQFSEPDVEWYEHRLFFTTNPSLYRRSLIERGWPEGSASEGRFTHAILADKPEARFAYLGRKEDEPWVLHIGATRTGTRY